MSVVPRPLWAWRPRRLELPARGTDRWDGWDLEARRGCAPRVWCHMVAGGRDGHASGGLETNIGCLVWPGRARQGRWRRQHASGTGSSPLRRQCSHARGKETLHPTLLALRQRHDRQQNQPHEPAHPSDPYPAIDAHDPSPLRAHRIMAHRLGRRFQHCNHQRGHGRLAIAGVLSPVDCPLQPGLERWRHAPTDQFMWHLRILPMRKVALNLALRHVVSGSDRSDSCRGRDGVIQMGKSAVVRKPTSNAAAMFTMKFRTSPRLLIVC